MINWNTAINLLLFFYLLQYSVFGSTLTIGGVIGGLLNGKIADIIGRRGVSFFKTEPFF
jgi:MFS family permease